MNICEHFYFLFQQKNREKNQFLKLLCAYCLHHFCDVQPYRADPYASAAADAPLGLKLFGVDMELTHKAVTPPLILRVARVVPSGVEREAIELAGVPVLLPLALVGRALVGYIEAVTGRAGICTRAAPEAFARQLLPHRVFVVRGIF